MILSNLVLVRKKYKITQADIAEVIEKTNKTVSLKENGEIPFTQEEIIKIIKFINLKYDKKVSVDDIFFTNNITESVVLPRRVMEKLGEAI